jgi:hypothetical protein
MIADFLPWLDLTPCHSPLLAYGPVPGIELIPYFLALLGWIVLAVFGVFFSPIMALIRRIRGVKPPANPDQKSTPPPPPSLDPPATGVT